MKQLCAFCAKADFVCPIFPPFDDSNHCVEFQSLPGKHRDEALLLLAGEVQALPEPEAHKRWRLMVEILEGKR